MANMNRTKVITGINTKLSYFHGWEPVSINGGAEKYSVSVLIPKDDTETVNAVNKAIDAAIEELKVWAEEELKPKAQMTYDGDGEYLPGEWCTFCKVSVKCRARAEEKMKLARLEFKMPPLLTDAEIEEVLDVLPDLTKWAKD